MKIAVATPEEMEFVDGKSPHYPGWVLFPTDFVRPSEIRARIAALIQQEEDEETEFKLVTMNRTVLDQVTHHDAKSGGPMDYEDVALWSEERGMLVPLLEFHDPKWLSHFALGDVLDREL